MPSSGAAGRRGGGAVGESRRGSQLCHAAAVLPRRPAAPPPRWTCLIDLSGRPGPLNMSLDQAMLARAARGERWLRLYRWAPHCLSFGRHEPAARRYDRERIEALGLDVVRRPTGGRAVWHGDELTYAVALPAEELGGLRAAYLEIHRMLLDALRRLGVAAELAEPRPAAGVDAGACFASPAGGEVLAGGRKLVGSAQLREGGGLLQHGSILLGGDQAMVRAVTHGAAPADLAGSVAEAAGRLVSAEQVAEAVATEAQARWGGEWRNEAAEELLGEAGEYEARFRSSQWTWRS